MTGHPTIRLAVAGVCVSGAGTAWWATADSAFVDLPVMAPPRTALSRIAPPPVVIDGAFEEWAGLPIAVDDPADAPGSAVDLGQIRARHDEAAIYLLIDLGRPVNAEALPGTLSLVFDADADPETGWEDAGLAGADLAVDLCPPYGVSPVPPGLGTGARIAARLDPTGPAGPAQARFEQRDSYDAGFVYAPKYASRWIELRVDRGTPASGPTRFVGEEYAAKVVFRSPNGEPLDEAGPFLYRLRPEIPRPAPSEERDPLARSVDASFRLMSWNVSGRNLLERTERFRRIISAVRPDLLLLDEVPGGLSPEAISALLPAGPDADGRGWEVRYGEAGGRQRGVIAARVGRLGRVPRLERVEYPDGLTEKLMGATPLGFGGTGGGIPTLGAALELAEGRLLVSTSDLQCCGNGADTSEETVRVAEAESIKAAIRRELSARDGEVDAVLVAGDLNLVGTRRPLDLLAGGLDVDGSDLADAHPLDLGGLTDATWSGAHDVRAFTPGRLDVLLYSDSSLQLERAFVLSTGDLSAAWLEAYGLEADDSDHASDHRPIVADLSWIEPNPGVRRGLP